MAQGSRFDSLLEDAGRFLERKLKEFSATEIIKLQPIDEVPPLPVRNPHGAKAGSDTATPAEKTPKVAETPVLSPMPLPERNPLHAGDPTKQKPPHPREIAAPDWTEQQIAEAKSECETLLAGLGVDYSELDPIREGRCGSPYPIQVSSIGKEMPVRILPPAKLTCAMARTLSQWLAGSLQPLASEYLGSSVTSLRNVSSYACRNRYNNLNKRLSEHALANALDIAAFVTEEGKTVTVLSHWQGQEPRERAANNTDAPAPTPAGGTAATDSPTPDGNRLASAQPENAHEKIAPIRTTPSRDCFPQGASWLRLPFIRHRNRAGGQRGAPGPFSSRHESAEVRELLRIEVSVRHCAGIARPPRKGRG